MSINTEIALDDLPRLYEEFFRWLPVESWEARLRIFRRQVQENQFIVRLIGEDAPVELGLMSIISRKDGGWPDTIVGRLELKAASFIGAALEVRKLCSEQASVQLRQRILGDLKTKGLNAINFELSTIAHLSRKGFSLDFVDIEGASQFDFFARFADLGFEIECKFVTGEIGRKIRRQEAFRLFAALKPSIADFASVANEPTIIVARLPDRLDANVDVQLSIHNAILAALRDRIPVEVDGVCSVSFCALGSNSERLFYQSHKANEQALVAVIEEATGVANSNVFWLQPKNGGQPIALAIQSEKADKVLSQIELLLLDTAKRQLTGRCAGCLFICFGSISVEDMFSDVEPDDLRIAEFNLRSMAARVFERRPHVHSVHFVFPDNGEVGELSAETIAEGALSRHGRAISVRNRRHPMTFFDL